MAVIKRSSSHDYSFFIAVNREEKNDSEWKSWGYHWNRYPNCYGCMDVNTGGSWVAVNDDAVVAILINKELTQKSGSISRAFVVLEAIYEAKLACDVIDFLSAKDFSSYKPFSIVAVDNQRMYYFTNEQSEHKNPTDKTLCGELFMINRSFPNDFGQSRVKSNYDKFLEATEPNPSIGEYKEWISILSETCYTDCPETELTMTLVSDQWKTLSSVIISIPSSGATPVIKDCEVVG
jgi:uncharacterized protein with NRDE domain